MSLCSTFFVYAQDCVSKPSASEKTPPADPSPETTAQPPATKVEEIRPSLYYLPDKQGNLQAVLDFNYEEFIELYKLKERLAQRDAPPRYTIERMSITGSAGNENAELTIQFQIMVRGADWTRVPLRLDQAILSQPAQYQGSGEHFVQFASNGDGYVSWIRAEKEGPQQISLKMLVPLSQAGEEKKLKIFTPRATASEMKLKIPQPGAVGTVSEGAALLPASAEQDGTLFTATGLGGEFQLAWHKAGAKTADVPAVLEATGDILNRLDSQGVVSEAILSLHSYALPFDRFTVRLPPDAELVPGGAADYSILPLDGKDEAGADARHSVVEVRLHKKTASGGNPLVRAAKLRPGTTAASVDLAGFEVLEAARQWGTIAVAVSNDRQVVWGPCRASSRPIYCPNPCMAKASWPVLNIPLILTL